MHKPETYEFLNGLHPVGRMTIPSPPGVLADSKTGTKVDPVQLYHLGIWFNDPNDAAKAGCGNAATTFTSNHHAGPQILNTGNYPDLLGPLFYIQ
jgi:hypothetical protein